MLKIDHLISREIRHQLEVFSTILLKWQSSINLIGSATQHDIWQRHIIDSLQIAPSITSKNAVIADFGTGAGFPGIILSIYGFNNVHLIESDKKKTVFLQEVIRLLKLSAVVHSCRIEKASFPPPDIIVSRACTSLERLLSLGWPKMHRETICLFHKGKNYATEIQSAEKIWDFNYETISSITDDYSCILKISDIHKK